MNARLTLRPGAVPGEVVGEVTVTRTPVIFDFNAQNFGSRDVGRWGGNARARFAGLTGMGALATLSFYATPDFDEQKVVQEYDEARAEERRVGKDGVSRCSSRRSAYA